MRLHLLWGTNCSIPRYGRRRRQIQSRTISSCLSGGWLLLPSQWGICYNNIPRLTTNKDSSENHVTFPSGENIKFAKVTIWTLKKNTYILTYFSLVPSFISLSKFSLLKNYCHQSYSSFPFSCYPHGLFCYPVKWLDILPGSHTFHLFSSGPIYYVTRVLLICLGCLTEAFPCLRLSLLLIWPVSFYCLSCTFFPSMAACSILSGCSVLVFAVTSSLKAPTLLSRALCLQMGMLSGWYALLGPLLIICLGHFCFYRLHLSCSPIPHSFCWISYLFFL